MASHTWGDLVRVKQNASDGMRPGTLADVCGMRQVDTTAQAEEFDSPIGTTLYLVEFGDGTALEIPERFLEPHLSTTETR